MSDGTTNSDIHTPKGGARFSTQPKVSGVLDQCVDYVKGKIDTKKGSERRAVTLFFPQFTQLLENGNGKLINEYIKGDVDDKRKEEIEEIIITKYTTAKKVNTKEFIAVQECFRGVMRFYKESPTGFIQDLDNEREKTKKVQVSTIDDRQKVTYSQESVGKMKLIKKGVESREFDFRGISEIKFNPKPTKKKGTKKSPTPSPTPSPSPLPEPSPEPSPSPEPDPSPEPEPSPEPKEEKPYEFTVTSVAIRQPAKAKEQEQIQEQDPILPHLQNIAKFDRSNENALNGTIGEVGEINTILNNMNIVDSNDRMSRILQSADVLREQNRNNPELVENFDQNLRSSITHFGNIEEAQQSNTIAELETLRIVANPESGITKENIQDIRPDQLSEEYKHTLQNGGCGVKIGNMKIVKDENGVEYYKLTGLDSATGDSLDGVTIRIPVMDGDKRRNAVDIVETFRRGEIGQRIENGLVQMFDKDNKPVKELSEEQKDAFKRKSIADINKLRAEKEEKKSKEQVQKQTQNPVPKEVQESVKDLENVNATKIKPDKPLPTDPPSMQGEVQEQTQSVGLGGV